MKKNAIVDLLVGDLKEMQTLADTFREPDRIARDFLALLLQKHESIGREIQLLNYWVTENMSSTENDSVDLVAEVKAPEVKSARVESARPQVPVRQEAMRGARDSEELPHVAPKEERRVEETHDYFEEELAQMEDPFADLPPIEPKAEEVSAPEPELEVTQVAEPEPEVVQVREPEPEQKVSASVEVAQAVRPRGHGPSGVDITTYGTPVSDVRRAIGINDRFLFMRELFGGDRMAFDATLETINAMQSYEEAHAYLGQTFGWDETDVTVESFLKVVHRRFL